jgi:hypothetical protein
MARVELDLLMAESGVDRLYELCRSMTNCGLGRNVTIVVQPETSDPL